MCAATTELLPPPVTRPLDRGSEVFARVGKTAGRLLAAELTDGEDAFMLVSTRTWVDVGSWIWKARVRVMALADALFMFAPGKRPYVERIPFAELVDSQYNHVTGELSLDPAEGASVRSLRVAPLDGYQLLAQIHAGLE